MTLGPKLFLEAVSAITSLDVDKRNEWADAAGFYLDNYSRLDDDERRALAPAHVWCLCIEPFVSVRGLFLDSIDTLAVRRAITPPMIAEVLDWLAVTGTHPVTEVDFVESLRREAGGAGGEVRLTPERVAPFVDVLRGITSASEHERASAARIVPDLLPGLRREEQWGFTGVLARAAAVEADVEACGEQLRALARADQIDAVHPHDGHLLGDAFASVALPVAERDIIDALDGRRS